MIEYVLKWCDQAPFKTVTVVCATDSLPQISLFVAQYRDSRGDELNSTSTLSCIGTSNSTTGSVLSEALRTQKFLYNENVVILPCDFITDVPPQVFIEIYRGNSDENLGLAVSYNNMFENIDNKILKTNYTVYANQANGNTVLLDLYSKTYVALTKFLKVRTQLLWRYPETKVSTNLLDSFIFFVNSKIIEIISDQKDTFTSNRSANKIKRDIARRSWSHSSPKETVGLFVLPKESKFARCNNLAVYMETNRFFLMKQARKGAPLGYQKPKENKNAANVGADCIIGENTELGDHTNVKRSVIGNDCVIGKKCRITGCILLDGVTLENDVHLENCILGRKAKLETKSRLVNCNIEGYYIVGKNVSLKGENLTNISLDKFEGGKGELEIQNSSGNEDNDDSLYSGSEESEVIDDEDDEGSFDSEFVFGN
ncbi:DEKNAAC101475 [Brettanomyces naardenensis]|uniref:Translation initiation factor eIF2B subunit gamma n=1 Tax=Brettanomyces naardenensis TaxID=13370 RepID=A0A448YI51_BRENA|nr:DEKNAAC101475 [Brettanomyces naardenensis]